MQKSTIKLTNHQLDFASSTEYPLLKHQIMEQVGLLLHDTANQLNDSDLFTTAQHWKVTRGENYDKMPYLALDFPSVSHKSFPVLYRTLFWWGHYFSLNLLVRRELLTKQRIRLSVPAYVLNGEDLWDNNVERSYIKTAEIDLNSLQGEYVRIAQTFPISAYEQLNLAPDVYKNWKVDMGI
ncbi:MAG: hypothetical protein WC760_00375 [Bacteroidia bacterium]|jgi:hypothetical protein